MGLSEKSYWLGFSAFPGIGPLRFKLLAEYFGSAKRAWLASEKELSQIGLGDKLTAKFVSFRRDFSLLGYADKLVKENIRTIALLDYEYPKLLKEIAGAPFLLYLRGNLTWDIRNCLGVVGTRKITNYGREVTTRLTEDLVSAGLTIVSGMAYGVDTTAHQAAIAASGKTIAVLGCGIDVIYPKSNAPLYWKIVKEAGAIVSEFPPGHIVERGLFPARNRIISGLSLGVVVTEGASDSGALITARYAAEQGREVFAVPGPITSEYSKGPLALLKQGAKLVSEAKDILEELNIRSNVSKVNKAVTSINNLTKEERKILEILANENLHFDEIARRTGFVSGKLGSLLTMMEMKGYVKNLGGGIYGV